MHHDLWDSDLPNNGVMFDGTFNVDGKMVKKHAVSHVNKVGMTFVLDRITGKPLIPVKETPVPQSKEAGINTWPTQPVPATQNVLFNPIGKDGISQPTRLRLHPVRHAAVRDPPVRDDGLACELIQPGDPLDDHVRCHRSGNGDGGHPGRRAGPSAFGGLGANRLGVSDGSTPISNSGNFTSLNVETGKYTFHQHWTAICYSGSANTAGGIAFVGHFGTGDGSKGDGYLEAANTRSPCRDLRQL